MFADNTEASEITYTRAEFPQLDKQLDNESLASMDLQIVALLNSRLCRNFKHLPVLCEMTAFGRHSNR